MTPTDSDMGFDWKAESDYADFLADLEEQRAGRESDWDYSAPVPELHAISAVTDLASDRAAEMNADRRDADFEDDYLRRLEAA
jgi:hypothetical protein